MPATRQARKPVPRWQTRPRTAAPPRTALAAQARFNAATAAPRRHRRQTTAVWWGVVLTVTALVLHAARARTAVDVAAATVWAAGIFLATRHLDSRWTRRAAVVAAGLTMVWLPLIAALGPAPSLAVFAACWAAFTVACFHHYRGDQAPATPSKDEETWARLAEHKRWNARLGNAETIPNGRRYPIRCDGVQTHIGDVLAQPLSVAAAWHKPITEAYVEPSPDGVASRGTLTILRTGTLQGIRHWDGEGVTGDGFARVARFADGADARIRIFAPMDGARHSLIAGTTGAGKSELLGLLLHVYLTSGFIFPVVLDPQEGQSLPDWQGVVPYAAGAEQCMEMLRLIHQMMYSRSRRLASMTWDDQGHTRRMSFFDHQLTGWPLIRVIADEAHVLLSDPAAIELFKDIGKLGRKTGTGVDLVTQVPSLEELGSQTLRSMLRGGNVICLRTADRVSAGMLGLPADPHDLPQYFANGDYTYGLGYVIGPDRRQAIARTDIPTSEQRRRAYTLPALEADSQAILNGFGSQAAPGPAAAVSHASTPEDSPAPDGQTAADAILAILDHRMSRGDIIIAAQNLSLQWGRPQRFSLRAVTLALAKLAETGRVTRHGDGSYERGPHLQLVRLQPNGHEGTP